MGSVPEDRGRKARPSMAEIATTAKRIRKRVCPKTLSSFMGFTPRIKPPTMAARKQPVPVAESHMKAKTAPSGVGLPVTGLSREIFLSMGEIQPLFVTGLPALSTTGLPSLSKVAWVQPGVVWRFIQSLIGLCPQRKTKTERTINGIQAL